MKEVHPSPGKPRKLAVMMAEGREVCMCSLEDFPWEQMLRMKPWGTEQPEIARVFRNLKIILWEFLQKAMLEMCGRGQ